MKTSFNQLIIKYQDGSKQVVKPDLTFFEGDWGRLAESIVGSNIHKQRFTWEVR